MTTPKRYDTCPNCGRQKRGVAALCKSCTRKPENEKASYDPERVAAIDSGWFREFCGLFFGEGAAMIIRNNSSFAPCLCFRLRDDDAAIVLEVQRQLGGRVLHSYKHDRDPSRGDQIEWRTTNLAHVKAITYRMLNESALPAKKLADIRAVYEFCLWRESAPLYLGDTNKQEAERQMRALQEGRKYRRF